MINTNDTDVMVAVISKQLYEIDPLVDQLIQSGISARGYFNLRVAFDNHRKKKISAIILCCEHSNDDIVAHIQQKLQHLDNVKLLVYAQHIAQHIAPESTTVFLKKQNPPQNLVDYLTQAQPGLNTKPQPLPAPEQPLSLDQTQAQALLSSIDEALISLDGESRIDYLNSAAERLLGTTRAQAFKQAIEHVLDLRDPDSDASILSTVLQKSLYQGLCDHSGVHHMPGFHARLYAKTGKLHQVCVKGGRYFNAIKGMDNIIVIRDLTEQFQAELDIRERERKYWSLINTTHLGYCVLDQQGKLVDANEDFLRITGFDQLDAVLGTEARHWLPDYEKERFEQECKQLMVSGKIIGLEFDILSTGGKITPIEFSASILKENGEIRILGVGRDISQRRQDEKEKGLIQTQLRQAQKMEAIGQLTGGIAHDFNNVLASILGYTELAQHLSDMADQDPFLNIKPFNKKLHAYLNSTYEAGIRARDLVKQLLIFSRNEDDVLPQAIRVEPTVNEILKLLASTLPKSLHVSTVFEENLPLIEIAPIQLHQVIMNLCINARDALNEKGNISIIASKKNAMSGQCASCHEGFHGNFVEISVIDDGSGIDPQHVNRIFEPFYTTKDVGQGTGMGLSIVHGIIHEHHGHITVQSSPNRGTAFHLLLPASYGKEQTTSLPSELTKQFNDALLPATGLSSGHIVVIDDEESLAHFLSDLLATQGYRVTTFTDSLKAKAELPALLETVDLVLTDHTMPGITGSQLAQYLLKLKPDLAIILCTGFSFTVDEKMAYQIGIRRFLQKPISTRNLLKEIDSLLQTTVIHRNM